MGKINILQSIAKISEVFKEGQKQKKWSAKRSVSGILVTASVTDMAQNGLTEYNIILSFIAVLPLIFSVFSQSKKCVCSKKCNM